MIAASDIKLTEEQDAAVRLLTSFPKDVQTLGGYAGCLSGNTVLWYNRGNRVNTRRITLRELYLKFNGFRGSGRGAAQRWNTSLPTYLYSVWPDGSIKKNRVVGVLKSGVKKVVKIRFSNGSSLTLTEDHPVATPSLEFVEAGTLQVGDAVLAIGDMKTKSAGGMKPINQRPPRVVVNVKYHPRGAKKTVTCNGISYQYTRVHRAVLVVEAAMNNVSYDRFVYCLKNDQAASAGFQYIPRGFDVHHIDEDTLNDSIDNLEVLEKGEHSRRHSPGSRFNRTYSEEVQVTSIEDADETMTYDIQMSSPANNFAANGIFVHNTGKTTVIKTLKRLLPRFAVCAFTGKAANVLKRKGVPASTIHSLIFITFETDEEDEYGQPVLNSRGEIVRKLCFDLRPPETLDCDGFVVDEGSMVGGILQNALASFGRPIIYVGDHGQLEPVGDAGSNLMAKPDITLETIHRNAGEIARFAEHLRRGRDAGDWRSSEQVQVLRYGEEMPEWDGDQIICAYNRTRVAVNMANRAARGYPADRPVVGDKVMCLQNDRLLGVFNGMQGEIVAMRKGQMTFRSDGVDFVVRYLPDQFNKEKKPEIRDRGGRLPFDYAYAVTAHKAQGDEWDSVLTLEQRCAAWDHRRWAYTAASRARERVTWVTGADYA